MSTSTRTQAMSALFLDREGAERGYRSLHERGYSHNEITMLMADKDRTGIESVDEPNPSLSQHSPLEGAGVGGAIGSIAGGLLGAAVAMGTNVLVPGLGLLVAGPLAGGLAGAGAGGLTGGLVGALVNMGVPEQYARDYEISIRDGGIILGVTPHSAGEAVALERDLRDAGAVRVDRY